MKPVIGLVGVGNMGGAMAAHLLEQGWPVQVCDLEAAKVRALQQLGAPARDAFAGAAAAGWAGLDDAALFRWLSGIERTIR